MKRSAALLLSSILLLAIFTTVKSQNNQPGTARIVINADLGTEVISRHIYGHFSEHLGRCIYDGYWVGE